MQVLPCGNMTMWESVFPPGCSFGLNSSFVYHKMALDFELWASWGPGTGDLPANGVSHTLPGNGLRGLRGPRPPFQSHPHPQSS